MTLRLLLTQLQPFICSRVRNKPTCFQPLTWTTRHQSQHLAAAGAVTLKPAFTTLTGGRGGSDLAGIPTVSAGCGQRVGQKEPCGQAAASLSSTFSP